MLAFLGFLEDLWVVLVLFIFIWLFGWGKENLGSPALAIFFAIIVIYLTFFKYPFLVWVLVGLFVLQTFGKEFIAQVNPFSRDELR